MARSRTELDPRFRRLMNRLPDTMTDPISKAIADSTEAVYLDAYQRVPVDTGDLRDSIGKKITPTSGTVGFHYKTFRVQWRKAGWRAKFVELGTKGSAKRNIPPMPPRPFMRSAFEANRRWIMERHRAAVAQTLARAASL